MLCETGGNSSAFAAARLANQLANPYTDEAVKMLLTLNDQKELN